MGGLWGGPFQGSRVCLFNFIYLFWLCWVFITAQASRGGFSRGAQALWQAGFSSCSTWLSNCGPQA